MLDSEKWNDLRREKSTIYNGNKNTQADVRVYLNAPKEEELVPTENIRATRKNVRNMPNVGIANQIAGQRKRRQKIRQKKSINIIVLMKNEAELQLLDYQFKKRITEATRNITTMQQNVANALNNNNNNSNEMDHHSSTPPPEEEPPDSRGSGEDSGNSY